MPFSTNDVAIVKHSAIFLEELSKHAIDFVQQHCMRLLVPLLARPAYQIRNAVLECVAAVGLKSCQAPADADDETEENAPGSGVDDKLRCSVCDDREKTTCLIRCMHTFCRECVQKNIDNRSRKCPACGERFGKDDVKDIYLVT